VLDVPLRPNSDLARDLGSIASAEAGTWSLMAVFTMPSSTDAFALNRNIPLFSAATSTSGGGATGVPAIVLAQPAVPDTAAVSTPAAIAAMPRLNTIH